MLINSTASVFQANVKKDEILLGLKIAMGTLVLIGILPGVVGNILVIIAITTTRLSHMIINLLVLSLALTDVLICIFPMPVLTVYFIFYWPAWMLNSGFCTATVYVVNVCGVVSILTMAAIALDRYFAVQRRHAFFSRKKCIATMVIIWIFSAAIAVINVFKGGINKEMLNSGTYDVCNRISGKHISDSSTKLSLIIKLLIGLPIIIGLVLIYTRMSYSVWKRRNIPTAENTRSRSVRQSRSVKIRALHMMFAIVIAFAICWIPYYIVTFLRVFQLTPNPDIDPGSVLFSYCLAMLNSTVNPILYALLSKRFRNAFKDILTGARNRRFKSFTSDFRKRSAKI